MVGTYSDRYTEVAVESQITDQDILVNYFADEQTEKKIGEKIVRDKCKTLQQAIMLGFEEDTYLRKFSLCSWGNEYGKDLDKLGRPQKVGKAQQINYKIVDIACQCFNKDVTMQESVELLGVLHSKGNDSPRYKKY